MFQDPDRMTGFTPEVDLSLLPRTFIASVQCAILSEQARIGIYIIKYADNSDVE